MAAMRGSLTAWSEWIYSIHNKIYWRFAMPSVASTGRRKQYLARRFAEFLENRLLLAADVWQNVELGGGGYVTGIVADPNVNGLFYARTDVGGAYRWTDAAARWEAITQKLPNGNQWDFGIQSVAVDPSDDNTVYIQTSMYPATYAYSKLYKSTNAGTTWTQMKTPTNLFANANGTNRQLGERLAVDPNNSSVIYLASIKQGLWKSTNGATTVAGWTQQTAVPLGDATNNKGQSFVVFDRTGGTVTVAGQTVSRYIYVGVFDTTAGSTDGGVWKSSDGGVTWSQMTGGQATPARAAIDPTNGTFYVTFLAPSGTTNGYIMKAARTATALANITPAGQPVGRGFAAVSIDPNDDGVVMVTQHAGQNMATYRSTDFGTTWSANISASANKGTMSKLRDASWWFYTTDSMVIDPFNSSRVWVTDLHGVVRTDNATAATPIWNDRVIGIEETFPHAMKSSPTGPVLVAAMQDVTAVTITDPSSPNGFTLATRTSTPNSFGASTGVDFSEGDPTKWVRVQIANWGGSNAYISTNGAANWTTLSTPSGNSLGGRISMSATNPNNVVWLDQYGRIFYTNNAMSGASATWTQIPDATFRGPSVGQWEQNKSPIASDRVAANTYYVYKDGGSANKGKGWIYRSSNGGASWQQISEIVYDPSGVDYGWAFKVIAAPNVAGEVWVAVYAKAAGNYVYKTTNAHTASNVTFTKITGIASANAAIAFGAPALGHTNAAAYVHGSYNGVSGVWQSDDGGNTWSNILDPNFTLALAQNIEADRQVYGRVYIGTNGRGIYYGYRPVATFTGGSTWNSTSAWSTAAIPGPTDTAEFVNVGTSGTTVALGASQSINKLQIGTTNAFTIGNAADVTAGNALTLNNVDRIDVSGTEGTQTIASPVALAGDSTWTVNGSGALKVTGAIAGAGLTKAGLGELQISGNTYTGPTTVAAGLLRALANDAVKGALVINGGTFTGNTTNSIAGSSVTINAGGVFNPGANENVSTTVINGGTANLTYYFTNSVTMTGGTLNSGSLYWGYPQNLTTLANTATAVINSSSRVSQIYNWNINTADGAAAIDMDHPGLIINNSAPSTQSVIKTGAGVALFSRAAGNTYEFAYTKVNAGTLLINNTSGSGTGKSTVQVNSGGTFGGTGIIGGVAGYTTSNVTVAGTSTTYGTLAPGMSDAIGTLTVGSAAQANNVTIGSYGQLAIGFASGGTNNDLLVINGVLDASAANSRLAISVPGGTTLTAPSHTLVTFTSRMGAFANVTGVPAGYQVVYNANSITLEQTSGLMALSAGSAKAKSAGVLSTAPTASALSIFSATQIEESDTRKLLASL